MKILNKWWWKNSRPRPLKRVLWWQQRVERGFSDEDWWSFDHYLAKVIAEGCRKFRHDGIGYPSEVSAEEWLETLGQIEFGFQQYSDILDAGTVEDEKRIIADLQKSGELLIKWFPALWD